LFAKDVRRVVVDGLLELIALQTLPARLDFDLHAFSFEFAARDDVAIHLGGNLFDYFDVWRIVRRNQGKGRSREYYKTKHKPNPQVYYAAGRNCSSFSSRKPRMSPAPFRPSSGNSKTPAGVNCAPRVFPTKFIRRAGSTRVPE